MGYRMVMKKEEQTYEELLNEIRDFFTDRFNSAKGYLRYYEKEAMGSLYDVIWVADKLGFDTKLVVDEKGVTVVSYKKEPPIPLKWTHIKIGDKSKGG